MPAPKKPAGPVDPKLMTQFRPYMVPPPMPPMPPGGMQKPPRAEVRISSKDIPQPARSLVIQKMLGMMGPKPPGGPRA